MNSDVEAIAEETRSIDVARMRAADEIQLLNEYRTRLIADVVTGKLDVRGVELPEVKDDDSVESLTESDDEDLSETDDAQVDETVEA